MLLQRMWVTWLKWFPNRWEIAMAWSFSWKARLDWSEPFRGLHIGTFPFPINICSHNTNHPPFLYSGMLAKLSSFFIFLLCCHQHRYLTHITCCFSTCWDHVSCYIYSKIDSYFEMAYFPGWFSKTRSLHCLQCQSFTCHCDAAREAWIQMGPVGRHR